MNRATRIFSRYSSHTSRVESVSIGVQIKNQVQQGHYEEALELYSLANNVYHAKTDEYIIPSILKACSFVSIQNPGKKVHGGILKLGLDADVYVSSALIRFYLSFVDIGNARQVFDETCLKDAVLWNVMIDGYIQNGYSFEGLHLFSKMQLYGVKPDEYSLSIVLGCRSNYPDLRISRQIHAFIIQNSLCSDQFLVTALIDMYAKCGVLVDAYEIFDKAGERNSVTWNSMISGFVSNGFLEKGLEIFTKMHRNDIQLESSTIVLVLQACAQGRSLVLGMGIHSYVIRMGQGSDSHVSTSLLTMYMKCTRMEDAHQVFDLIHTKEIASWNAMIAGYSHNDHPQKALMMFVHMKSDGAKPDTITISSALVACAFEFPDLGESVHADAVKRPAYSSVEVQTALLTMYANFEQIVEAESIFRKIEDKDLIAYSSIITGFCLCRKFQDALNVFKSMLSDNVKVDSAVAVSLLMASATSDDVQCGIQIHAFVLKNGFTADLYVGTALIDMYAKCRFPDLAGLAFSGMPVKNLVSWNAMISGYAKNGRENESIGLFAGIWAHDLKPNSISLTSVLAATSSLSAAILGKSIHGYTMRNEFLSDPRVYHALIDMYMKCGHTQLADQVFHSAACEQDATVWNTMISGYGSHGQSLKALEMFNGMLRQGKRPDYTTFLSLISACSHSGLVCEGFDVFRRMSDDFKIEPRMEHYACMVDLVSRAGHLHEAELFIQRMPIQADARVLSCLLSGCKLHNDVKIGEQVGERMMTLDSMTENHFLQLLNLYEAAGLQEKAAKVRVIMKEKGLRKTPGYSWIEVKDNMNVFLSMESTNPKIKEVYNTLDSLTIHMQEESYVPQVVSNHL